MPLDEYPDPDVYPDGRSRHITIAPRPEPGGFWPPSFTPQDVAMLRRELVAFHTSPLGISLSALMCRTGRQVVVPRAPSFEAQARVLCGAETARLRAARLFYATAETVELIGAAYDGFPSVPPQLTDPPSESGFIVFGTPLLSRPMSPQEIDDQNDVLARAGRTMRSAGAPIYIAAASWGPFHPDQWAAGCGIWVSFYATRAQMWLNWSEAERHPPGGSYPTVNPENETAWQCLPEILPPGKDTGDYTLPDDRTGTAGWGRLLTCVWALMKQQHLVESNPERVARPERRRHEREGLDDPRDVVVVNYRGAVRAEEAEVNEALAAARPKGPRGEGESWYRVRFPVAAHWRNQWYPREGVHKPRRIPAHWKGPDGAPVRVRDRIEVF